MSLLFSFHHRLLTPPSWLSAKGGNPCKHRWSPAGNMMRMIFYRCSENGLYVNYLQVARIYACNEFRWKISVKIWCQHPQLHFLSTVCQQLSLHATLVLMYHIFAIVVHGIPTVCISRLQCIYIKMNRPICQKKNKIKKKINTIRVSASLFNCQHPHLSSQSLNAGTIPVGLWHSKTLEHHGQDP